MEDGNSARKNFWQTLPGIFTAFAGIITAITGLLLAFNQLGCFDKNLQEAQNTNVSSSKKQTAKTDGNDTTNIYGSQKTSMENALKPWAESDVIITTNDGAVTTLKAESLSNCISVDHSLQLSSGQETPFEKMLKFEVLHADMIDAPEAKASLLITLLDGTTIKEKVAANCDIFGYNDLGRFTTTFQKLKVVEFRR